MSGVNSKFSRGDLTAPRKKPVKVKGPSSKLPRIGSTEQMEPQTSRTSPADQVLIIPDELLTEIFGYLAAGLNLEELMNLRLVCRSWKREVFLALKSNLAFLPWVGDNRMTTTILSPRGESWGRSTNNNNNKTERGVSSLPASLCIKSCTRNLMPGCGVPLKVVINNWTRELASFLRNFSSDIVSVLICSEGMFRLGGFPKRLGRRRIELPELEHASFCVALFSGYDVEWDEFVKALAFWKMLLAASKKLKTCHVDIGIPLMCQRLVSPDDEVFNQLEWSGVNSLSCSYEFFAKVTASNELSALQKLRCGSTCTAYLSVRLERQLSFEKVANVTELTLISDIDWILNHPMQNLKVLRLENVTIACGQSPSALLPKLEKITVLDLKDVRRRSPISCLISGRGAFENVVKLSLTEWWANLNEGVGNLAVQLFDSFPKLKELNWDIPEEYRRADVNLGNQNALKAAPVIFSKLEHLTRLKLMVSFASGHEVVELITGITLEEIPQEEGSWPNALVGNSRSITNLKHLESFELKWVWERGTIRINERHTRFLFTAAFRTMATLNDLWFTDLWFDDTSYVTEWRQMGRKIKGSHFF